MWKVRRRQASTEHSRRRSTRHVACGMWHVADGYSDFLGYSQRPLSRPTPESPPCDDWPGEFAAAQLERQPSPRSVHATKRFRRRGRHLHPRPHPHPYLHFLGRLGRQGASSESLEKQGGRGRGDGEGEARRQDACRATPSQWLTRGTIRAAR